MSLIHHIKGEGYRFEGIWRGVVVDNNDPLRLARVKVRVYPIMDAISDEDLPWAEACFPGIIMVPQVGNWVWVTFQEGDVHRPVWLGWSMPFGLETPLEYVANALYETYDKLENLAGDMANEEQAAYPYMRIIRHRSGSRIVFYEKGKIKIYNPRSYIVMHENGKLEIGNSAGAYIVLYEDGRIVIKGKRIDLNP